MNRAARRTFLVGDRSIAAAVSGGGPFSHTFGGPHDRNGASRADCHGLLLHLLHRFDLTDLAVPIAIPGARWLPLYYCFDFRANEIGYRLVTDDEMAVYIPANYPNVSSREEWPAKKYPREFPLSEIAIEPAPYDSTQLGDAHSWGGGVFGVDHLDQSTREAVFARAAEWAELSGSYPPETEAEFRDAVYFPLFTQGKPVGGCLNPECSNFRGVGQLRTIAKMPAEPVHGVSTFGDAGDVELVFRVCDRCYTIRVANQCT